MTKLIEAAQQALEALEDIFGKKKVDVGAINALRQAIEQAEKQEPVALQMDVIVGNLVREGINKHRARELAEHFIKHTTPPAAPVQEPVAFKIYKPTPLRGAIPNVRDAELPWVYDQDPSSGNVASMWVTPVKATPQPQREWVGLSQEDIDIAFDDTQEGGGFNEFARAIEQTLRRKNS